jgi:uncharacterized protein (DUF305 family)
LLVHQTAHILWATVLFGLWGRKLARSPKLLLAAVAPWAVVTSMIEYYVVLPWLQPLVPRQVPYWTALLVHLTSGAGYTQYPAFRRVAGRGDENMWLAKLASAPLAAALAMLVALELRARIAGEQRLPGVQGERREHDRRFLKMMTGHHLVGVGLSRLAAERAEGRELRMLGRLMLAQHEAEIALMRKWWRGWFGGELPPLSTDEYASMRGMPHPAAVAALEHRGGRDFDREFIALMVPHHQGAIEMSEEEMAGFGDPRMLTLAASIIHTQRSQVARMLAQDAAPDRLPVSEHLFESTSRRLAIG